LRYIYLNSNSNWGYINYTSKKWGKNTWRCPKGVEPQNPPQKWHTNVFWVLFLDILIRLLALWMKNIKNQPYARNGLVSIG
jgi:hypothetical protein